jgi:hypothetical protein
LSNPKRTSALASGASDIMTFSGSAAHCFAATKAASAPEQSDPKRSLRLLIRLKLSQRSLLIACMHTLSHHLSDWICNGSNTIVHSRHILHQFNFNGISRLLMECVGNCWSTSGQSGRVGRTCSDWDGLKRSTDPHHTHT